MDPVSNTYPAPSPVGLARHLRSSPRDERTVAPRVSGGDRVELSPRALLSAGNGAGQQELHASGTGAEEFIPYGADGRRPSREYSTHSSSPAGQSQTASTLAEGENTPQVQQVISRLQATEIKVKAHEAAHKAAGGAITGPVSYSYSRGPDGKSYVTGGEVSISVSSAKTPEETVRRMEQVIRAALAPADPSPQDRAVAAKAAALAQQARLAESTATPSPSTGAGQSSEESGQASRQGGAPGSAASDSRQRDRGITTATEEPSSPQAAVLEDAVAVTTGRRSPTAYGDPAASAPQEKPLRPSVTTGQGVLQAGTLLPANHGQNSATLSQLTPAMITGFGATAQLSLYA